MPPDIIGNRYIFGWNVDLTWEANLHLVNGTVVWLVRAEIELPDDHPLFPGQVYSYEVETTRPISTAVDLEALLGSGVLPLPPEPVESDALDAGATDRQDPSLRRHPGELECPGCARRCLQKLQDAVAPGGMDAPDDDRPSRQKVNAKKPDGTRGACSQTEQQKLEEQVHRAYTTLLRCLLNPLCFDLHFDGKLELTVLCDPRWPVYLVDLLEPHRSGTGLMPLIAKNIDKDAGDREALARVLYRMLAAGTDSSQLGRGAHSLAAFAALQLKSLISDTWFIPRKVGARYFLVDYMVALAFAHLPHVPPAERMRRAKAIARLVSVRTCRAHHAGLKGHFTRRYWVCFDCEPAAVSVDPADLPIADLIQHHLTNPRVFAETGQVDRNRRTCLRNSFFNLCLQDKEGNHLAHMARQYLWDQGLTASEVELAFVMICSEHCRQHGLPCARPAPRLPSPVTRAVALFWIRFLPRAGSSAAARRLVSAIRGATRHSSCADANCRVMLFRDIQFSRIGPRYLDQLRSCFLLPEDCMWYFWRRWRAGKDRGVLLRRGASTDALATILPRGKSFLAYCRMALEQREHQGQLHADDLDTLVLQIISYFPDDHELVPLWEVSPAFPQLDTVLGELVPGLGLPWRQLNRSQCWKYLMQGEDGPKIPPKAVASFHRLLEYQLQKYYLEDLQNRGEDLSPRQQDDDHGHDQ